ncbi:MAG: replication initiation protein [Oscillospiraceae bacterium]|jgi:plasmid replication initiation protein|nr:replication initiation protein [Oscillospiraceae bacterium]
MRSTKWDLPYRLEEIREMTSDSSRNQLVVKSNALIQRAKFNLTMMEQRIVVFLISKIKPGDTGLEQYYFSFKEFCNVCGIELDAGNTYDYLRDALKHLSDKSIWIDAEWDRDGKHYTGQTLVRWVNDIEVSEVSSAVWIEFHKKMLPYLFQLRDKFTQYQLRNVLAMNSTYAAALYELLKSYEYLERPIDFSLEELKFMLGADDVKSYDMYNNFKRKVIDKAVSEINTYSDLNVEYKPMKRGKKVTRIIFAFRRKDSAEEQAQMLVNQEHRFNPGQLPGQISMSNL